MSFEQHIRPLFREQDRQSMSFAFDLWSVTTCAPTPPGSWPGCATAPMPCDAAWPQDRIATFQRWTESGQQD